MSTGRSASSSGSAVLSGVHRRRSATGATSCPTARRTPVSSTVRLYLLNRPDVRPLGGPGRPEHPEPVTLDLVPEARAGDATVQPLDKSSDGFDAGPPRRQRDVDHTVFAAPFLGVKFEAAEQECRVAGALLDQEEKVLRRVQGNEAKGILDERRRKTDPFRHAVKPLNGDRRTSQHRRYRLAGHDVELPHQAPPCGPPGPLGQSTTTGPTPWPQMLRPPAPCALRSAGVSLWPGRPGDRHQGAARSGPGRGKRRTTPRRRARFGRPPADGCRSLVQRSP